MTLIVQLEHGAPAVFLHTQPVKKLADLKPCGIYLSKHLATQLRTCEGGWGLASLELWSSWLALSQIAHIQYHWKSKGGSN